MAKRYKENHILKKKKNSGKRYKNYNNTNKLSFILYVFFIFLLVFSLYKIFEWFNDNKNTANITNSINDFADVTELDDPDNAEIIPQDEEIPKDNPYWSYIKMSMIDVDINELKAKNPDTVGWIQVNGTNINYPIVQTTDNDYYLTHAFDKSYNDAGWIFMDYRNNSSNFDNNTIIYGHARLDTTMFGSLKNILDSGWYNNSDNYVVKFATSSQTSLWQVFSVYKIPTTSDYLATSFSSNSSYQNFLNIIKSRSEKDFNTNINSNDKILTLSTCKNNNNKVVLHAKLIKILLKN